jgi:hypothetical protein
MYAHQVIDGLDQIKQLSETQKTFLKKSIKNSFKFHFDSMGSIQAPFINTIKNEKVRVFLDKAEYAKFPYDICWFDYGHSADNNTKEASLTICINDEFRMFHFVNHKTITSGRWAIDPAGLHVRIGNFFNDGSESNIKHFLTWGESPKGFDLDDHVQKYSGKDLSCIYFVITLLNCKNISAEKNYPPEALNKKRVKKGKQPLFTYHTLVVNPIGNKKRSDGVHEPTGIKQRLHFCRGHFKEYTPDKPLFGKLTGLYWWQPMVRGNKELGIVHKDYEVRAA